MFKNQTVLITGGTGLLVRNLQKLIKIMIQKKFIFSRDELKQFEMKTIIFSKKYKIFFLEMLETNKDSKQLLRERFGCSCRSIETSSCSRI